ncbi:hypothetical protein M569_09727, partial [Genlisea aurea]
MSRMSLTSLLATFGVAGDSASWWHEINESVQWQDGIFFTLCSVYALVSAVAL